MLVKKKKSLFFYLQLKCCFTKCVVPIQSKSVHSAHQSLFMLLSWVYPSGGSHISSSASPTPTYITEFKCC